MFTTTESNPNYERFKDLLEDGWFGNKVVRVDLVRAAKGVITEHVQLC